MDTIPGFPECVLLSRRSVLYFYQHVHTVLFPHTYSHVVPLERRQNVLDSKKTRIAYFLMCVETLETCLSRLRKKENISELRAQTDPRPETRERDGPRRTRDSCPRRGRPCEVDKTSTRHKKKSEKTNAMLFCMNSNTHNVYRHKGFMTSACVGCWVCGCDKIPG